MGGRFSRRRKQNQFDPYNPQFNDPFYSAAPPGGYRPPPPPPYPYPPPPGYDPSGGLGEYDPNDPYGYGYGYGGELGPTEYMTSYYGRGPGRGQGPWGGRYARGFNQMPNMSPWNYGNFYMGNTTMQMMPLMMRKVGRYVQQQAMGGLGGAGCCLPMMPMMPMMPMLSMPMAAPMVAAATPLPIAFNPLVQGMYPMASTNPVTWMNPTSFMNALSTGPMPYRPPGLDFPSNVGMVMTIPYGTPNPLLLPPSFGGFSPSYGAGGGMSCCCCYCTPAPAPPPISYYPRPVPVPQPYPVPYINPVPITNIQQVPVPRSVPMIAPPIVAGANQSFPMGAGAPLMPSYGGLTQGVPGQISVMASNSETSTQASTMNQSYPQKPQSNRPLPIYDITNQPQRSIGRRLASSLSNLGLNNLRSSTTQSKAKNGIRSSQTSGDIYSRLRRQIPNIPRLSRSNYDLTTNTSRKNPVTPPILSGILISDSGWLPKNNTIPKQPFLDDNHGRATLVSNTSHVSFQPRRRKRSRHSNSSVSEYDCPICQEERTQHRLRNYFGSSTLSSILSSTKDGHSRHLSSSGSATSITHSSTSFHTGNRHKRHHGHRHRHQGHRAVRRKRSTSKQSTQTSPSIKHSSPTLIRQSRIQEKSIFEDDESILQEPMDNESTLDKYDHHTTT